MFVPTSDHAGRLTDIVTDATFNGDAFSLDTSMFDRPEVVV
jgi:hypothetical protein